MSITPAQAIAIQGDVSLIAPPPHQGYFLRLVNKGPEKNYLDLPIDGILSPIDFIPPAPSGPVECLVKVGVQFRFSDYPVPPPLVPVNPIPFRPAGTQKYAPKGLFGSDGTVLEPKTNTSGQITALNGQSSDGFTYSLTLNTLPVESPNEESWSEVWISLSKNKAGTEAIPPLQFTISYNPLQSQFGVGIVCGNVTLGIRAQMSLIYPAQEQEQAIIKEVASLERLIAYYGDLFGTQTINMDGNSTDPAIYLPIAGVFWPYTNVFGFFAPALAYLASQTGNTLLQSQTTPLSVLAQLQYLNNPGLKYPPSLSLDQFIANATAQIGPVIGPFAAEFLPAGDSGIQSWIDAASWMGWVLAKGSGVPSLARALTTQYNYWKNFVPSPGNPPPIPPKPKAYPVTQPPAPGQRVWALADGQL